MGSNPAHESALSNCVMVTPQPFAGTVVLNQGAYSCSAIDRDHAGGRQHRRVHGERGLRSTSESTPENVILTQVDARQTDLLREHCHHGDRLPAADGQLSVAHGDTITVAYVDADDGNGSTNVLHEANGHRRLHAAAITAVQSSA